MLLDRQRGGRRRAPRTDSLWPRRRSVDAGRLNRQQKPPVVDPCLRSPLQFAWLLFGSRRCVGDGVETSAGWPRERRLRGFRRLLGGVGLSASVSQGLTFAEWLWLGS